jgi:spore maturation protein SpmA
MSLSTRATRETTKGVMKKRLIMGYSRRGVAMEVRGKLVFDLICGVLSGVAAAATPPMVRATRALKLTTTKPTTVTTTMMTAMAMATTTTMLAPATEKKAKGNEKKEEKEEELKLKNASEGFQMMLE